MRTPEASAANRVLQMMMEHQQLLAQKQEVERMLATRDQRIGLTATAAGGKAAAVEGGSGLGLGGAARPSSGFLRGMAAAKRSVGAEDVMDEFRGAF